MKDHFVVVFGMITFFNRSLISWQNIFGPLNYKINFSIYRAIYNFCLEL